MRRQNSCSLRQVHGLTIDWPYPYPTNRKVEFAEENSNNMLNYFRNVKELQPSLDTVLHGIAWVKNIRAVEACAKDVLPVLAGFCTVV